MIPKHEASRRNVSKKPTQTAVAEPAVPGITLDVDMTGIEDVLGRLADAAHSYLHNNALGENSLCLFTGPGPTYSPLRLVLEGNAVDSIADSLKCIADATRK
jgi:hypothetical protein